MIVLKELNISNLKLFMLVLQVYLKYLKYAPKSITNTIFKSISKHFLNEIKFCDRRLENQIFEIRKYEATVFCSAILYYLGYPDRDKTNDQFLRNIAIKLIKELKNDK